MPYPTKKNKTSASGDAKPEAEPDTKPATAAKPSQATDSKPATTDASKTPKTSDSNTNKNKSSSNANKNTQAKTPGTTTDIFAKQEFLTGEVVSLFPSTATHAIPVEVSAWPFLVEAVHREMQVKSSLWAKMVPGSVFALYCYWHLQYRLIKLKGAANKTLDADEVAFQSAFEAGPKALPRPLVVYLSGLGHFSMSQREKYNVEPTTEVNANGHFGRLTTATAWLYCTAVAPAILLERVVKELNYTGGVNTWTLPAAIYTPDKVYPGLPTRNCLGYMPLSLYRDEARSHYLSFLDGADSWVDVPSATKFKFIPDLMHDIAAFVASVQCQSEEVMSLAPTGSRACALRRECKPSLVTEGRLISLHHTSARVTSSGDMPDSVATAAMQFGFRIVRTGAPAQWDSPIWFAAGPPPDWMDNKDDWLNTPATSQVNAVAYVTTSQVPITSLNMWVRSYINKN